MTASQIIANEINKNKTHLPLSGVMAYHLLSGSLTLANTEITTGFATTLYTGNGTTQSVNTGVDMSTQWGNDASETFGGLVWIKGRSGATSNYLVDTVRGATKDIYSNATTAETTEATGLTAFSSTGFTLGALAGMNTNLATYASWVFQTTHRKTGVTNHGKAYTCHYNPFTGFTIVKYEGSGLAGHEIPHHLGRKLEIVHTKNTSQILDWISYVTQLQAHGNINLTSAINLNNANTPVGCTDLSLILPATSSYQNASANQYIMYGWANSYFDEANTLIGNYEVGVYQGTGAAGNKVTTRGKPAWVIIKSISGAYNWEIFDNKRNDISSSNDGVLYPNANTAEYTGLDLISFNLDGFILNNSETTFNGSGGQYLYMVVYDNDSGSGKSKYPRATDTSTLNLNATVPFANGIDVNGTKNSILVKNETVNGLTLTKGKNYIYAKNDGTYGLSSAAPAYGNVNPASGDFFNVLENKWYTSAGVAITESRNYLDAIVYADQNGQPTYVEQLPKTVYFDEVKANEFKGKNACTAWVNFDGTTTPPTIRDSYNVKAVIRTGTGSYSVYFKEAMDNINYTTTCSASLSTNATWGDGSNGKATPYSLNLFKVGTGNTSVAADESYITVNIFGGKN